MKYHLLGHSGIRVSELCLGTMTFGNYTGWGNSEAEARQMFDRFVAAGGNFFDTANIYQSGDSEQILGRFIASDRHRQVIATKYSLSSNPEVDPNARGNHRKNMMRSLEESLRRLRTDYVDLFWVHAWDTYTPEEETLRALDDAVRQGKILSIGLSDTPAWVAARSEAIAELRGWTRVSAIQLNYSLIERSGERELIPMAVDRGLSMLLWGALGAGVLTGKYSRAQAPTEGRMKDPRMVNNRLTDRNHDIADVVGKIAAEMNVTASQVALAWVRSRSDRMIPLIGARTVRQLTDNLGCLSVALSPEARQRLDAVSAIDLGFPQVLLGGALKPLLHGVTADRIAARSRL